MIAETYTAEEIVLFYENSVKAHAQEMLDALTTIRYGNHADKNGMQKLVSQLERQIRPENAYMNPEAVAKALFPS